MTGLAAALASWLPRPLLAELADSADLDGRVVVACSGGADSLALLALACASDLSVTAVYVDHGLRAGTEHEAATVRNAAAAFGAHARVESVTVGPGASIEAHARAARYAALERVRVESGAVAILVAHTRDDQAETVLLNLLRGGALTGLAGMRAVNGRIRRPLLDLRRADTTEICARLALAPCSDPMNADRQHRRVWLRREVLPMLAAGAGRDLIDVLARQAALLRDDGGLLDALARETVDADSVEFIDAATVAKLPRALARRVVRAWLGDPPPPADAVESVLEVCHGNVVAVELPGGRRAARSHGLVHLLSPPDGTADRDRDEITFELPGAATWDRTRFEAWVETAPPVAWPDGRETCVLDADRAGPGASVRAARPGERFRPLGLRGSKLVFDALAEVGRPAAMRGSAPIVAAGAGAAVPTGEPLWVVGYRIDDRVRVTSHTRRYLWLRARGARDRDTAEG